MKEIKNMEIYEEKAKEKININKPMFIIGNKKKIKNKK
jgi:hypothetical protein